MLGLDTPNEADDATFSISPDNEQEQTFKLFNACGLVSASDDGKDLYIFVRKVVNVGIHFGPVEPNGVQLSFTQSGAPIGAIKALGLQLDPVVECFSRDTVEFFIPSEAPLNTVASATSRKYFKVVDDEYVEIQNAKDSSLIVYSIALKHNEVAYND